MPDFSDGGTARRRPGQRLSPSDALQQSVRTLYEDTLVPVREIARLAGVTERNLYAMVRRLGCRARMRLASGGGRRIVPLGHFSRGNAGDPSPELDNAAMQHAIAACAAAVADAERHTQARLAERERLALATEARREQASSLREMAALMSVLRDRSVIEAERSLSRPRSGAKRRSRPQPRVVGSDGLLR